MNDNQQPYNELSKGRIKALMYEAIENLALEGDDRHTFTSVKDYIAAHNRIDLYIDSKDCISEEAELNRKAGMKKAQRIYSEVTRDYNKANGGRSYTFESSDPDSNLVTKMLRGFWNL